MEEDVVKEKLKKVEEVCQPELEIIGNNFA